VGASARDALWDYPDLMPSATDIDDPAALVARLEARARGEEPTPDELDDALARLLAGEVPTDAAQGDDSSADDDATAADDGDDNDGRPDGGSPDEGSTPDDHRPV
jgi:hypothetical protein